MLSRERKAFRETNKKFLDNKRYIAIFILSGFVYIYIESCNKLISIESYNK